MFDLIHGAIGEVHSINEENYTVKVKLYDYENHITKDLQVLTPISFKNKINCIPHVGTPVIVIAMGNRKFVLGGFNSTKNMSNKSKGKLVIDFQESKLEIIEDGNINITSKNLKIDTENLVVSANKSTITSEVEIIGNAKISGRLEANEVKEGEIILGEHKHKGVASGISKTGFPTP